MFMYYGAFITQLTWEPRRGDLKRLICPLYGLSFATSQPEFLPTEIRKPWKAMNTNKKQSTNHHVFQLMNPHRK